MKRNENHCNSHQNKRPKLDSDLRKPSYTAESARLIPEWDDDLNGDLLEEVCIIAELSQVPREAGKPHIPVKTAESPLEAENRKLKEALKTREGEVGILRSQLKQNHNAKQNESLNHRKNLDKLEERHKANIESVKKQLERLQSEIEFKDLEVKGLVEKCKQLEVKSPGVNFVQPGFVAVEEKKNLFSLSQAISAKSKPNQKRHSVEAAVETNTVIVLKNKERKTKGEGERLALLLNPSFFRSREEPSLIPMYASNPSYRESLDHAKSDKYKWVGLPKYTPRLHLLQPILINLLQSEEFSSKLLSEVHNITLDIAKQLVELLKFLNKLPMSVEHDKALLSNMDPGRSWSLADILSDDLLHPVEKAVEARRMLGAICCIAKSSQAALKTLASLQLITLLHEIVVQIGKQLRPVEFSGVCLGILFFLQIILDRLDEGNIDSTLLVTSRSILAEIILSRPKLDVLGEVVSTLSAGAHHDGLAPALCRKSPADTSALYMDARLQQALFFTRDACPLKLLQIQVETLAHFCNSPSALMVITRKFTSWFNSLMARSLKPQLWLFPSSEQCCNILKCFCYLLTLAVPYAERDPDFRANFERGIVTLRDCSKGHKKKLKQTTLKLLPFTLRSSTILDLMSAKAREAAFYVISEYETDLITQESAGGNTLNCSDS